MRHRALIAARGGPRCSLARRGSTEGPVGAAACSRVGPRGPTSGVGLAKPILGTVRNTSVSRQQYLREWQREGSPLLGAMAERHSRCTAGSTLASLPRVLPVRMRRIRPRSQYYDKQVGNENRQPGPAMCLGSAAFSTRCYEFPFVESIPEAQKESVHAPEASVSLSRPFPTRGSLAYV